MNEALNKGGAQVYKEHIEGYVLITPARNEAEYLPQLIDSILKQKVRPVRWIIVSDNSTDGTDDVVVQASNLYPFITLIRASGRDTRCFGSKALAFGEGYKTLQEDEYDYIGNLDADVTMAANYYERIIAEMKKNPRLGVASGVVWDKTDTGFTRVTSSLNHAVGAVQFWRRACFEAVGGYKPVSIGGIDSLAELTARMQGWETRSFPELAVHHHKPVDSASGRTGFRIAYRAGLTDYHIGTMPLFAFLKAIRRWREKPIILSSVIRMYGYGRLYLSKVPRDASKELVEFVKKEQTTLIKQALAGKRNYS